MTHRYFCCVVGRWKLQDWHVYRWREHHSARNANVRWHMWDLVL